VREDKPYQDTQNHGSSSHMRTGTLSYDMQHTNTPTGERAYYQDAHAQQTTRTEALSYDMQHSNTSSVGERAYYQDVHTQQTTRTEATSYENESNTASKSMHEATSYEMQSSIASKSMREATSYENESNTASKSMREERPHQDAQGHTIRPYIRAGTTSQDTHAQSSSMYTGPSAQELQQHLANNRVLRSSEQLPQHKASPNTRAQEPHPNMNMQKLTNMHSGGASSSAVTVTRFPDMLQQQQQPSTASPSARESVTPPHRTKTLSQYTSESTTHFGANPTWSNPRESESPESKPHGAHMSPGTMSHGSHMPAGTVSVSKSHGSHMPAGTVSVSKSHGSHMSYDTGAVFCPEVSDAPQMWPGLGRAPVCMYVYVCVCVCVICALDAYRCVCTRICAICVCVYV
jgi:hypothetical protein